MSRVRICPTCGERIPSAGECLYCEPGDVPAAAPPPPPPPAPPPAPAPAEPTAPRPLESDRALGLALFEAEEALARGQSEKAVVMASRAVRDRPDSITARALYERARRDLLRGLRRERLEQRVGEARGLLAGGDLTGAERIVGSALKLIPDHPVALELLAQLRERRHAEGSVEAEAERELAQHETAQARRSLEAARAALAVGSVGRAVLAVRRGLRQAPGDAALLSFLRELQQTESGREQQHARHRALVAQTRAGLDLLARGRLEESRTMLRAVLREDPDNIRAQAAVQQLRRTWLRGQGEPAPPASPAPARNFPPPRSAPPPAPGAVSPPLPRRPPAPVPPPTPARPLRPAAPAPAGRGIPPEILLPRTRRRATPFAVIFAALALVAAVTYVVTRPPAPSAPSPVRPTPPVPPAASAAAAPQRQGPLAGVEPDLREAVDLTLALYARALESQDAEVFAQARPDLSPQERMAQLAALAGALNVGVDLRVLDVAVDGPRATVPLLRTDVVVGGRNPPRAPFEEVLVFERGAGGWALRSRAAGP